MSRRKVKQLSGHKTEQKEAKQQQGSPAVTEQLKQQGAGDDAAGVPDDEIAAKQEGTAAAPVNESQVVRTEPVSNVIELEPSYRTRYVAWAGIMLLWLASLGAVLLRGDAPEWLLLTTLSLVILCSGMLPLLAAYRIGYERVLSTATVEQGELHVMVKLTRGLPIPGIWYSVYDQLHNTSTMRGQRIKLKAGFMPLFHKTMSLTYRIQEMERGSYKAKPTIIRIGDWLGLTCITVEREMNAEFIVLPQVQEPEEESYVARNTSSTWMKRSLNAATSRMEQTGQGNDYKLWSRQADEQGSAGSSDMWIEGNGLTTRPYVAGDSYRRLDSRAAVRGMGLHTRVSEEDETAPKLCVLLDQYDLPYEEERQDQLFHALVNWCLVDIVKIGESKNISVLSDNWSFEYRGQQHSAELKYLLALTRPDMTMHLKDRIPFLTPLLPGGGHIVVYSGAWKDSEGWLALAEAAWMKGSRLELQFVTTNRVMTYAMREQQKILESAGIQIIWRYSYIKPASIIEVEEGSERYASGAR